MDDKHVPQPDFVNRLPCRIDGSTLIVEGEADATTVIDLTACCDHLRNQTTVTVDLGGVTSRTRLRRKR